MTRFAPLLALSAMLAAPAHSDEVAAPTARERIGTVLGEPIYRDQINTHPGTTVQDELHRLVGPAVAKYRAVHEAIEPTDAELDFAAEHFRKEDPDHWREQAEEQKKGFAELSAEPVDPDAPLEARKLRDILLRELAAPPARSFARFVVGGRKFQRHLYDGFGGGRLLFQQAGVEAFDAHRRWLESLEAAGDFAITDSKFRAAFYEYWTNDARHGAFLSTPEKNPQAFEEFLNPPWLPAAKPGPPEE